jgi:NAD(P)-dependent dehydrogenase (short-subunit alcohol dehydrogenase family)
MPSVVLRLAGHVAGGPSAVFDHSRANSAAREGPSPARNSSPSGGREIVKTSFQTPHCGPAQFSVLTHTPGAKADQGATSGALAGWSPVSVLSRIKPKGPSGFGYGTSADAVTEGLDLRGKNILVTGSNSGIGLETVRVLAGRGARVLATGRTREKVAAALAGLAGEIVPLECELANPSSVRACVAAVQAGPRLDALIGNAGIMATPALEQAFGYEKQFFTNHVGHFLLVQGLLEHSAPDARFVIVASNAHRRAPASGIELDNLSGEKGYSPWTAYGQSKLANILFASELSRRLAGSRRSANALHPGVIHTNISRSLPLPGQLVLALAAPLALKSAAEGAATQCYVATHPSLAGVSGEYFADCNIARTRHPRARDAELARRLWQETERIVATLP